MTRLCHAPALTILAFASGGRVRKREVERETKAVGRRSVREAPAERRGIESLYIHLTYIVLVCSAFE